MTTPSGTISLNDVNVELGFAGTTLISMNQTSVRTLAGVPSGTITMQNLQGKSNRVTANLTISSDTANYVLGTSKVTGYSAGKTDVTLTINSGIFVYSASTGSYALTVDNTWTTGDTITIVNNGTIIGRGGTGGNSVLNSPSQSGGSGGPALYVQFATSINNVNRISGGGGGGGGGESSDSSGAYPTGGSGGGGIGGSANSPTPPYSGLGPSRGSTGQAGTLTSAGAGGGGGYFEYSTKSGPYIVIAGTGGAGGTYGSSGSAGGAMVNGNRAGPPGSGGAAGAAVVGNSNITWVATGTRNGSIS